MRNLFLLLVIGSISILISCSKNSSTPHGSINDPVDTVTLKEIYKGDFINGPYGTVEGAVKILSDSTNYQLLLNNFNTSNGPDLHVYLSREVQPIHFIDLGKLKSVNGNQVYEIPGKPDFTLYKYALIHCQLYNHLFGSSELK
jgi:hypothetical protein